MNRTNNREVARKWGVSRSAKSHNGQFSTDGSSLYSYNQLIGITLGSEKVLLDYRSRKGGEYISQTTSTHVGYAESHSDQLMSPEVAREAGLI